MYQVLSSVRNKKAGAEVREGRSSRTGSIRRTHTKAPPKERPVSDMGKKARPTGPKQLSLRNVMTNPSSTISFVQVFFIKILKFYTLITSPSGILNWK